MSNVGSTAMGMYIAVFTCMTSLLHRACPMPPPPPPLQMEIMHVSMYLEYKVVLLLFIAEPLIFIVNCNGFNSESNDAMIRFSLRIYFQGMLYARSQLHLTHGFH